MMGKTQVLKGECRTRQSSRESAAYAPEEQYRGEVQLRNLYP